MDIDISLPSTPPTPRLGEELKVAQAFNGIGGEMYIAS
jgi:hypothetical protein